MRGGLVHHVRPLAPRSRCGARKLPPSLARAQSSTPPTPGPENPKDGVSRGVRLAFLALGVAVAGAAGYEGMRYMQRANKQILAPESFSAYVLTAKERVSATGSIFHLTPASRQPSIDDPYTQCWHRPVWSVQARQPQLQIARSYTPLPPTPAVPGGPLLPRHDPCALRFFIREEERGEVSAYLHRLPLGAAVDLRGPQVECELPTNVEEVVFLAGGTGIAPALQIASALRPGGRGLARLPRMHIVWANRTREDCEGGIDDTPKPASGWWPSIFGGASASKDSLASAKSRSAIVKELETLKTLYGGRLTVDYYVDEERTRIDTGVIKQLLPSHKDPNNAPGSKVVFVSGPEGFISYLAGSKEWKNGREGQGPLGGLLKEHLPGDWTAIKL